MNARGQLYNASLNVYYVAVVKHGKSEADIRIRSKMEPFLLHGVPIVWIVALTYTIVLLARKHLNDAGAGICTSPVYYPPHCYGYDVGEIRDGFEIPCGRGSDG